MTRFYQALLVTSTVGFSWLAMMLVHEAGHVIHAWLSGATVARVVLSPVAISRTDLANNPHPLFVACGGFVWGCLIPLVMLCAVRCSARSYTYLATFFAGFCLVANGVYLGAGTLWSIGDSGGLLSAGAPAGLLAACGVAAIALGLYLWHGLAPSFGGGASRGRVDRRAAIAMATAWLVLVVAELIWSAST